MPIRPHGPDCFKTSNQKSASSETQHFSGLTTMIRKGGKSHKDLERLVGRPRDISPDAFNIGMRCST